MEILIATLGALASGLTVARGVYNIGAELVTRLRKEALKRRTKEILDFLHNLGCLSEEKVRKLVEDWAAAVEITDAQQEELTMLLVNLTRGARFHTTNGSPASSYLRCTRLLEQLLADIQPHRRKDEPVGPGWRDWKLERFLGMGSFGEVWLCRNRMFPEPFAFKFFTHEEAQAWLRREQKTLFQIRASLMDCPNVIKFCNVGIDEQKYPFLMLEYVGGGSLEDWILSPPEERHDLEPQDIMEGVARGLSRAHAQHIYHRDLKPANILLTEPPEVIAKIADFGLGTIDVPQAATASVQASQGAVVGTPMYLPPEASDPYAPRLPAQDDVFAFGVMWYQILVGQLERPPYDFAERLQQAGAGSWAIRLIARCLAQPERRFADGEELFREMDRIRAPRVWDVPADCFDVGFLASEYLNAVER